jgi:hypothetical protein
MAIKIIESIDWNAEPGGRKLTLDSNAIVVANRSTGRTRRSFLCPF